MGVLGRWLTDFTTGVTIEFEGEFGATRAAWERIFDFAASVDSTTGAFWVTRLSGRRPTAHPRGSSRPACRRDTARPLPRAPPLARVVPEFNKWLLTLEPDGLGGSTCKIYKNGVSR
ncbi:MAG: hypothetical protein R2705_06920 [Ilumatobacteraceae bacterium]